MDFRGELMTLTNYWWLLIWIFAGGIILNSLPKQKEVLGERTVERWQPIAAILMIMTLLINLFADCIGTYFRRRKN